MKYQISFQLFCGFNYYHCQVYSNYILTSNIIIQNYFTRMKIPILVFFLIFIISAADDDVYTGPSEQDVIELDSTNLQSTIYESDETWLLDLHAPWCDHCKKLRPQWAKLATKLKGVAKVAKIDASTNRQFDSVYELKGYPHVVLIPAGLKDKKIFYKYDESRTAERMQEWTYEKIKEAKGYLVPQITSEEVWNEYCIALEKNICVIIFLPHILDSSQQQRNVHIQMIKQTINHFREKPVSFLWAQAGDHQQLQDQFSLNSGFPAVLLISPQKRAFSIMKSSFTQENFEEFLKSILGRRVGRGKFGQYSKALSFNTVETAASQNNTRDSEDEL